MKKEKIIIDTNIIVDVFAKREPRFDRSKALLQLCEEGKVIGHITASTATDIYYVVRKYSDRETAEDALGNILSFLTVIDVTGADVMEAYSRHAEDFEDCLLGVCAIKFGISQIVSWDKTGFNSCEIPFCNPDAFLALYIEI